MADLVVPAVAFAHALRAAGLAAAPGSVETFLGSLAILNATDRSHAYWSGRVAFCSDPDDLVRYDLVFDAFFDTTAGTTECAQELGLEPSETRTASVVASAGSEAKQQASAVVATASARERLRQRDVSELDEEERDELNRLLAAFELTGELRTSRRYREASRGPVDRHGSVRAMLRSGGEAAPLARHRPRQRTRPVVLLVDVSGSMSGYADALLRFAHATRRRAGARTEVFTLGTRTTRVTDQLAHRDPDTAMRALFRAVPDWEGGTRLGETLKTFLDRWGQRGTARGAVVVILSDGWETGDARLLGDQVQRLSLLAARVIWANPRAARPGFTPTTAGMAAALPWCDELVEGHSLAALERLARVVAGATTGSRGVARRTTGATRSEPDDATAASGEFGDA